METVTYTQQTHTTMKKHLHSTSWHLHREHYLSCISTSSFFTVSSEASSYVGTGEDVVFIESFGCRLFRITRHTMTVVITAVAADESNPVTNTDSTTVYGHKKNVQFNESYYSLEFTHGFRHFLKAIR